MERKYSVGMSWMLSEKLQQKLQFFGLLHKLVLELSQISKTFKDVGNMLVLPKEFGQ